MPSRPKVASISSAHGSGWRPLLPLGGADRSCDRLAYTAPGTCPSRYCPRPHASFFRSYRQSTTTHVPSSCSARILVETSVVNISDGNDPNDPNGSHLGELFERRDARLERRVGGE